MFLSSTVPGCHYKSDRKLKLLQFNCSHSVNILILKTSPDVCHVDQEGSLIAREDALVSFKPEGHQTL